MEIPNLIVYFKLVKFQFAKEMSDFVKVVTAEMIMIDAKVVTIFIDTTLSPTCNVMSGEIQVK